MAFECPTAQGLDRSVDADADAVRRLIRVTGEDPQRDGLRDTPRRVVAALRDMTSGYRDDPAQILSTTFQVSHDELVVLRGIRFSSLCEHHLLPFMGTVAVGYLPGGRVIGLSKLARLVHCFARRLQVQERMTEQIASALMEHADALGAGVVVRGHHCCMGCRGVRQPDSEMVTSCMLGVMRDRPAARAELLAMM